MKILRNITISIVFIFSIANPTLAYEVPAHQALTYKILQEYSRLSPSKQTELLKYKHKVLSGSAKEDLEYKTRPLNHFYDPTKPISAAGLRVEKWGVGKFLGLSAPAWAKSIIEQSNYGNFKHSVIFLI